MRREPLTSPRRVVFVAGVSRSGSTLLDFILGNRPDGLALGEIYAWYRPFRDHHLEPQCTCGEPWSACDVWRRVGRPKARHLHRTVADALALTTVVDSSKNLTWIRDAYRWADADGLEPSIVLSWRRPKAIAFSYWKRSEGDGRIQAPGTKPSWMTNLEGYVRRLRDLRIGFHVVSFDALIEDPAATIEKLNAAIGMMSWPGQERFWEGEYHSMFGSGGTKDQLQQASAKLTHPELPPEFLDYWEELPIAWRDSLDDLDRTVLSVAPQPSAARRLPPLWYVKSRGFAYRQEYAVRARAIRTVRDPRGGTTGR